MNRLFFHSSDCELPVGTKLVNCVDYEDKWGSAGFYRGLEAHRPDHAIAHKEGVFMVECVDDVSWAGGGEEFIFIVKPKGDVTRHDMHWSTQVTSLLDYGHDINSIEVREAAEKYWSGVASEQPAWEYICRQAVVARVFDFEVDSDMAEAVKCRMESQLNTSKDNAYCL